MPEIPTTTVKYYSPIEEKVNIISHASGFILSLIGFVMLTVHAFINGTAIHLFSFSIYGASLISLYAASTLYHSAKEPQKRIKRKIIDHSAIYILIAGTYTPFTLITLNGKLGYAVFAATWLFALTGIVLKLFFTGRYNRLSTLMYVLMGWFIIFAIKPLFHELPFKGFVWVVSGGISYTLGAILYSINGLKMNHAIFHFFVLLGSLCHFIAVFFYVLTFH